MNHDISHCTGQGCKRKDTCHRYKAHQEAERKKMGIPLAYIEPMIDHCSMYWRTGR